MKKNIDAPKRERIEALDVIRGVLIIGVICDHVLFDCVETFPIPYSLFDNPIRMAIHLIGVYLFIMMSGASSAVSRSNWKRGISLAAISIGVTLVTWIANRDGFIIFGILHLLSASTLIYTLARPLIDRIPRRVQVVLWASLTIITTWLTTIVKTDIAWLWIFGFPTKSFYSADYFPLFPWLFVYLIGVWISPYIFEKRLPARFYQVKNNFLSYVGRNSLLIYLLHQPVALGIIMIIADRMGV